MKYETPELVALNAINAVQSTDVKKPNKMIRDNPMVLFSNENTAPGYADWE